MDNTTPENRESIKSQLNNEFIEFFKPVEKQHKQLRFKMFNKKAECFSTSRKYRKYSLQDSELCSNKAGWPSYKLQLDITEMTKKCRSLLEYEDFTCQELAKVPPPFSSVFSFWKKEPEQPLLATNLEEVDTCLDNMVIKYRECLTSMSGELNDLYDNSVKNYETLIANAPKDYGYKKDF